MKSDISVASAKAAPPVGITALAASGMTMNDIVYVLTAVYLVLQIGHLVWKWVGEIRAKRKKAASE